MADELARVQKEAWQRRFLARPRKRVVQKEREKAAQFDEKLRTLQSELGEH